jgi:mono/diheme cytochrome c family protein
MKADPNRNPALTEAEPTAERAAVPMWLLMTVLVLLFLGAWYFDTRGGWVFNEKVYAPYTQVPVTYRPPAPIGPNLLRGKAMFEKHCAVCHNNDGMGKPGQAPPLVGSEWVTAKGVNRLIRIPVVGLTGPIKVKGQDYNLSMVGLGGGLSDQDVSDILSFIRADKAWGNGASVITEEQVKKVRTELGNRSLQYTADELLKLEE